ncbi:MAG: NYN domain-containing protein [Bacteroidota bacterium]
MTQACVLIDYQNLHHHLKHQLSDGSPADICATLLAGIRNHLSGTRITAGRAYADFSGLDDHTRHVKRTLYLNGIEPVFVPATMHRNTSDLQLAIDAIEIRERRPEIDTFVLLTGDRDYVPVVQALAGSGKRVVVVGFREHLSPFVLRHTGNGEFVDAASLLPDGALAPQEPSGEPIAETTFAEPGEIESEDAFEALKITIQYFGQYDEVYLTPLLRRLSDEMPRDAEPKELIAELEEVGAVKLERRRGMPYDYTVLLVNSAHPEVQEAREAIGGPSLDRDADDGLPFDDEPAVEDRG